MNKLDVAVDLLQLLNERKHITTRMVADELHVSMRTAQRYLLELSKMPCVIYNEHNHTYALDTSYKINEVLVNGNNHSTNGIGIQTRQINSSNHMMCLICGSSRNYFNSMNSFCQTGGLLSNKLVIDKLVSIIKKKLDCRSCCFP